MTKPDYILRAEAIAARATAKRDDARSRMRAEMPGCAELIDDLTRAFGRPAWISLSEGSRTVTAGRRGWFRRNMEHQPVIPGGGK